MSRLTMLLILIFVPVLLNGLFGCDTCNPAPYRFKIQAYRAYPRQIDKQAYRQYLTDTLTVLDTLPYRETELILIGKEVTVAVRGRSGNGTSAWACEPAVIALDTIRSLTIVSDRPYRNNLPAGSNLVSILAIGLGPYDQKPLADFLSSTNPAATGFLSVRFAQAPDRVDVHQFTVELDLGKGQLMRLQTKPVAIKP